jgi:N-acetylneuraminate synthase
MSANHNQSFQEATRILKAAKEAGADAVKLQTYTPDTLTIKSDKPYFKVNAGTPWDGYTLYDLYAEAYTPWEWQPKLKEIADELGLIIFSTPFDATAVDFLENMGVCCYKIASFELVDIPLIQRVAQTGKPIIMSIGMANLSEINDAVSAARQAGAEQIALLKCTSSYPANPDEMNLKTIPHLAEAFQVPTGLSDHTLGIEVPIAAVSLGAYIIEKHFTISRNIEGPDSSFSLEPGEFEKMVKSIRVVEKALGKVTYGTSKQEKNSNVFKKSLFFIKSIKSGEKITFDNVKAIRPGHGIPPKYLKKLLGMRVTKDIDKGTPVLWKHLKPTD